MLKGIGGFLELELKPGEEYHRDAIRLNTGRNAFKYILRVRHYQKVYIPYYTCDAMLEPILNLKLEYEFYSIDKNFRPVFKFREMEENAVFVFTNYFGLCDNIVEAVYKECKNLIIDNAQAFFSLPIKGVDTFYSARKFFGVPDGAYLYTNKRLNKQLKTDTSYLRFEHLLGRIDVGAEEFYTSFKKNDQELGGQPIKTMSNLTQRLMQSIDYQYIAEKRKQNYNFLHRELESLNKLKLGSVTNSIPMFYPFLIEDGWQVKKRLIENKIFVANYWSNVLDWTDEETFENYLTNNLIPLPIDQRYGRKEMDQIIIKIKKSYGHKK